MAKTSKQHIGASVVRSGVSFRVWAPFATAVDVTGVFNGWSRTPLVSEGDGYWAGTVENAEPGQEYKYIIQNGGRQLERNDPRALHVTTTAGNSVITDTNFEWGDDDFTPPPSNEQVVYELHIGTFNRTDPAEPGTFQSAADKLDYLRDLGVNIIELMPVGSMSEDHGWGYVPDYIYAIESLYGGRADFKEFVKAAHARGIGVILDVVYNHFGPTGGLDLWQFDGWQENNKGGIYFYNDWRAYTPWGENRPDYGRPEVRDYILDNVRTWMTECHLDGIRVDSTGFIRTVYGRNNDPSNDIPDGWFLLQRITTLCRKIKPSAVVVGEDLGGNEYITKPVAEGGAGFSAQWELAFPYFLRQVLDKTDDASRNLTELTDILSRCYNNDAFQRVIYGDSHDSTANGNARMSEEISPGNPTSVYARRRLLLASGLIFTAPGIPMMFQGQEFMEGGSFNDWQALDWQKADKFSGILMAHKHLIALRKNIHDNTKGLGGQSTAVLHLNEESKMLAYHRWDQGGIHDDVVVIVNFANRTQKDYAISMPRGGAWQVRFNSDWKGYSADFKDLPVGDIVADDGKANVTIAPYSVLILSQD